MMMEPQPLPKPGVLEINGKFVVMNNGHEIAVCHRESAAQMLAVAIAADPVAMFARIREGIEQRSTGHGRSMARFLTKLDEAEELWLVRLAEWAKEPGK